MSYTEATLNYYKKNPTHITADLDTDLLLALIDFNAENIQYVKPQTAELIYAAYNIDPSVFKYIDFSKISIQFLEQAIADNPIMIQHVYSPSPDIMKLALFHDLNVLPYIEKYLDTSMYEWLLSQNGLVLEFIPAGKQTENMVMIAIQQNIESYQYAHIKTKETDIFVVEQDASKIPLISNYWPELIIPLIEYNPRFITKFFKYPDLITQDIIKLALDGDPTIYKTLKNPTMDIMKYTVDLDINMLDYIPYNQELIDYAISTNGLVLKYVKKKDLKTIKNAISENVLALDYVEYPRQFLIYYAFQRDGLGLKYLSDPTYEQCLDAVERNPLAIQYVPENLMTKEIQLYALMGGNKIIPYINPVSDEVTLQILRMEPNYIFLIENPTSEMYITAFGTEGILIRFYANWNDIFNVEEISAALSQDGSIFEFVKYKTKRLALIAINEYPPAIQWTDFQDLEIAHLAVSLDPRTLFFVDRHIMDSELLALALELDPDFFTRTEGELTWEQWLELTQQ